MVIKLFENKKYQKKYYEDNKDKLKNYDKQWYLKNREIQLLKAKEYRKNNKEKLKQREKKFYEKNKQKILFQQKEYREKNKEREKKYKKEYYQKNKQYFNNYAIKRREENINFRVMNNLRSRLLKGLKHNIKSKTTKKLLGCSVEQLKQHIEKQFVEGMTWNNHGVYGWHIDHIKPCCSFDLSDPKQQEECFNYKNLQPLWAKDNLSKGGIFDEKRKN